MSLISVEPLVHARRIGGGCKPTIHFGFHVGVLSQRVGELPTWASAEPWEWQAWQEEGEELSL